MFKFTDSSGNDVWLRPSAIESIEHIKSETEHTVRVGTQVNVFFYEPTDEEDCRKFLFDLFNAMGMNYKYEG
jgi:hypothetical protein